MNLKVAVIKDYTVVCVDGRIDTTNANDFEKQVMAIIDGGATRLILDCSDLNYISSSGLRVFLMIQKKMSSLKGQFRICKLQAGIQEIFDISGFSSIFSLFPDQDAALGA